MCNEHVAKVYTSYMHDEKGQVNKHVNDCYIFYDLIKDMHNELIAINIIFDDLSKQPKLLLWTKITIIIVCETVKFT